MKNSHATPAVIARVDQIRARLNQHLDTLIDAARHHTASHDGEDSCSFAHAYAQAFLGDHADTAGLLAAAITRLAAERTPHP